MASVTVHFWRRRFDGRGYRPGPHAGAGVTLVERGSPTHGTTGRMHGLLHGGGR